MLATDLTRIGRSVERAVAAGFAPDEGQALVSTMTAGVYGVKPSTGAAGEQFVGVALSQVKAPTVMPRVEEGTSSAASVIVLDRAAIGGTIRLLVGGTLQTAGNPATTLNEYSIAADNQTITVHATLAETAYTVAYQFSPTVAEAITYIGEGFPGLDTAAAYLEQIGVLEGGDVFTSFYDTSVDWSANPPVVYLGAGGMFTTDNNGGNATAVPATVLHVPNVENSMLGLRINV